MGIDTIDPAYYTVADGDGQTTAAREAGVDVGGDPGPRNVPQFGRRRESNTILTP
jgi:hypothetical protein